MNKADKADRLREIFKGSSQTSSQLTDTYRNRLAENNEFAKDLNKQTEKIVGELRAASQVDDELEEYNKKKQVIAWHRTHSKILYYSDKSDKIMESKTSVTLNNNINDIKEVNHKLQSETNSLKQATIEYVQLSETINEMIEESSRQTRGKTQQPSVEQIIDAWNSNFLDSKEYLKKLSFLAHKISPQHKFLVKLVRASVQKQYIDIKKLTEDEKDLVNDLLLVQLIHTRSENNTIWIRLVDLSH